MSNDNQIGGVSLDGFSIDQLEVIIRLALNAEVEYDNNARTDLANQCLVLRNRAREQRKQMMLYPEAHDPNDIRAMYPDDFSESL